jgi:hypothetical protein
MNMNGQTSKNAEQTKHRYENWKALPAVADDIMNSKMDRLVKVRSAAAIFGYFI